MALMLGAIFNRFADASPARSKEAQVRGFHEPTKGPRRVTLQAHGERVSLHAELAEGCLTGDLVTIELRDGAFGLPWVSALRCPRAR
jgi:hypothetical protein